MSELLRAQQHKSLCEESTHCHLHQEWKSRTVLGTPGVPRRPVRRCSLRFHASPSDETCSTNSSAEKKTELQQGSHCNAHQGNLKLWGRNQRARHKTCLSSHLSESPVRATLSLNLHGSHALPSIVLFAQGQKVASVQRPRTVAFTCSGRN